MLHRGSQIANFLNLYDAIIKIYGPAEVSAVVTIFDGQIYAPSGPIRPAGEAEILAGSNRGLGPARAAPTF